MEKINKNDIVVSKVDQHTETGLCFISKNYISKAEYMDNEHLWFKETISGHGAYFIKHFRPATQEECRLFEEKGPHILSNTFSEDLTGRYLKALIDRPQCTSYQKGEYALIRKGNFGLAILDRLHYSANPDQTDWWELMPEGFTPPIPGTTDLAGRYVRALKDSPECTNFKTGEYALIKSGKPNRITLDRLSYTADVYREGCWELMPEGFIPPSIKSIGLTVIPDSGCFYGTKEQMKSFGISLTKRPTSNSVLDVLLDEGVGVGWNSVSQWWLKTKGSGKKEYTYDELKSFISIEKVEKKEETKYSPGDWVMMLTEYNSDHVKKGCVYRLIKPQIEGGSCWVVDHKGPDSFLAPYEIMFRMAEPHEIPGIDNPDLYNGFKVGDSVTTHSFQTTKGLNCIFSMNQFFNKEGAITKLSNENGIPRAQVHDWYWPISAIKRVSDLKVAETREQILLKKASEWYSIGVFFKSSFDDSGVVRQVLPYAGHKEVTWRYDSFSDTVRCENGMYTKSEKGEYVCSNPAIYQRGVWAEIVPFIGRKSGTITFNGSITTSSTSFKPLVVNKVNNVPHQEPKILRKKTKKRNLIIV